eukprot:COSAG03_NODE_14315_length_468_cov_1.528455_1_plen_59_part_01
MRWQCGRHHNDWVGVAAWGQADVRGRAGWRNFQFRGWAWPTSLDTSCISRFVTLAVALC